MADLPLETVHVPVPGGDLAVHRLTPAGGTPVVAVHGITANALSWTRFAARAAGRATVWAPDLRGRAASRDVGEPYGLGRHADDVVAALDALGLRRAVVAGHSMGAFVAALVAARHPDRVERLVLVDGGFAFPAPPVETQDDVDAMIGAVIGPALQRLSMSFASFDAYLAFFAGHPALGRALAGPAGDDVRDYLRHDLVEDGAGAWRSSCVLDAVRVDGGQVLLDAEAHAAAAGVPVTFLWAERGLMDESQGLYDQQRIATLELSGAVDVRHVPGTSHYSVLLEDMGVDHVLAAVRARGAGSPGLVEFGSKV